jgi:hypothetical protein
MTISDAPAAARNPLRVLIVDRNLLNADEVTWALLHTGHFARFMLSLTPEHLGDVLACWCPDQAVLSPEAFDGDDRGPCAAMLEEAGCRVTS